MAFSQIFFGQYHIWDIFDLSLKSKFFFVEKTTENGNHGEGTHNAKMGTYKYFSQKYLKEYSANLPNWPKTLKILLKKDSNQRP